MGPSAFRAPIIVALCVALLFVTGCSALRIGYNQADDLIYWWLDGYVDFTDAQTPRVRGALTEWLAWHRRTQLPDYARLLSRAQGEVMADSTPKRVCEWWGMIGSRIDTSIERAVPVAAELMLELTPQQIQHIERRYAKRNDDFRNDFLQSDAAERLRASIKRAVERAEVLYGRLDEPQRELVARSVAASPFDAELWFAERLHRQQDMLQMMRRLLRGVGDRDAAQAALRAYADRWTRSPREGYRRYADALVQYNCAFAASLHNSTNATQRQAAMLKLKGWEADARSLAAEAAN
jgi:hypothetical protein